MGTLALSRHAVSIGAAAALLAACGGSQPPIGAPGAMPQSHAIPQPAERGASWMLPEAKREDLLYVSDFVGEHVRVFSYPRGKSIGLLSGFVAPPAGLCSDMAGDVFVTTAQLTQSSIYEYAHAGTQPIATLSDPGLAEGCSVDPTTGNLAVANADGTSGVGNVAIYQNAEGAPTLYTDPSIESFNFCAYDNIGNLFADDGFGVAPSTIAELASGSAAFTNVTLTQGIGPGSLQSYNGSLVVAGLNHSPHGPQAIYAVNISGSIGSVGEPTYLQGKGDRNPGVVQFWAQGKNIIGPDYRTGGDGVVNYWSYPRGGNPTKTLRVGNGSYGVTVSVSPSP